MGELFTRPDLAQSVGYLSRFTANPTEEHWKALIRVLRYLRKTLSLGLSFNRSEQPELHAFSDSDFAGDKNDYKSTSGFVALYGSNVIDYGSAKQKTVARSSCEAETWRQEHIGDQRDQTERSQDSDGLSICYPVSDEGRLQRQDTTHWCSTPLSFGALLILDLCVWSGVD